MMKVLFAASECVPFVKTGGLADVVGALPKEILKNDVDVRVILPLYREIPKSWRDKMTHKLYFYVNLGWRRQYCGIEELVYEGITFYFVDNEYYFGRPYVYGLGGDEGERFAYFDRAVLEALPHIGFRPDVLHCHDWQTGMIPVLLKSQYQTLDFYRGIKTLFTVHNLQYQGVFSIDYIEDLLSLGSWAYTSDNVEFYGGASFMKGGLKFADYISTVSPTYALEIQSGYYGERLDGLLRSRGNKLVGILNGIDTDEYNPATDPLIYANYSLRAPAKKKENKAALQEELGLKVDPNVPLIGMVGRLSSQKGLELVEGVLPELMATGAQIAVLGKGDDKYVDLFNWAQWKYPGQLAARIEMSHPLAHKIYAGADMFLMPSMFEPCGLSQMISLRYGTIPIVRETGGLRDTVQPYNEFTGEGNGFTFANYNAHDMLHVVQLAIKTFSDNKKVWNTLMRRAMKGAYGWDHSALDYIHLYKLLVEGEPGEEAAPEAKEQAAPAPKARRTRKAAPKAAAKPAAKVEKEEEDLGLAEE